MPAMDGSSKSPQISDMFQKFALAFKTRTFEFFADDEDPFAAVSAEDSDFFSLLDSAEEIITDQKVVVIKPDQTHLDQCPSPPKQSEVAMESTAVEQQLSQSTTLIRIPNAQMTQTLISSIFATVSSIEASYLQLQTAHVPFVEDGIKAADKALVSHLQRLSDFKRFYRDYCSKPDFHDDFPIRSCLEAQVQENQSKLRVLGTVVNRLQSEIDHKDSEVMALRKSLGEIQKSNLKLSNRLSTNLNSSYEVLFTVRVFNSLLHDACKSTHRFTKILIGLMRKAGWDLDLVANTVYPNIEYEKKGHSRFAFLSYVCLGIFRGFDLEDFGSAGEEDVCNGHGSKLDKPNSSLKQLLEHVSSNPMEVLSRYPLCEFSRFCEKKYQELIPPTMESSIFSNLDKSKAILDSWRSLSVFYESFVNLASSIWMLHKLAYSFDPFVEIFQVERGVDYSMVYMEDVTKRGILPHSTKPKVAFTVIPGFKIGRTVIQSRVYLRSIKM